jgi:glycosyl transferase family 2
MEATVLIPTHDHGPLLEFAVRDVLGQTVQDFELFVVGDGVPDHARPHVARMVALDPRIRYFDFPKGRRTGEPYRNVALAEARGRIVCYHADDDLWLPHHLEQMRALLREADFAQALSLRIHPDETKEVLVVDLAQPEFRRLHAAGRSAVHLSGASHTLELFRRLPDGWRETPAGIPTDYYMWTRILEQPGVRAVSGHEATVLVFPSPLRRGWSLEERMTEARAWSARLTEPGFAREVQAWAFSALCRAWVETHQEAERRGEVLRRVHDTAAELQVQLRDKEQVIDALATRRRWLRRFW